MPTKEDRLPLIREFIVKQVRNESPDLSARQLGVFLICYMETEAQTVRGLAATLNISKPAITRALDRLSEFDLVRRKTDPLDRRSVLVQRTATGMSYLRDMRRTLSDILEVETSGTANEASRSPRSSDKKRASAVQPS